MKPFRALQAAALQVTVTAVFTMVVVMALAPIRGQSVRGALLESPEMVGAMPRMVVGVVSAFFAGWWGASGVTVRRIEQGLLIGLIVAAFGAGLALIEGDVGARASYLLLLVVAAVAGSIVARVDRRVRRALVAAAIQLVAFLSAAPLFMLVGVPWLTSTGGTETEHAVAALYEWIPGVVLAAGLITAFAAGWWAARGLQSEAVTQGLLTGTMIAVFSLVTLGFVGGIGPRDIPAMIMDIAAATSGAAFAGARAHRDSA